MPKSEKRHRSGKTALIEDFFNQRYDVRADVVSDPIVTLGDLQERLHTNVANFWKDIVRSRNAEDIWPASVRRRGYTGVDATGEKGAARTGSRNGAFRFVRLPRGETRAFPEPAKPSATQLKNPYRLQTLSIPSASRALGRKDENWLAQVAQNTRMVETHFATSSEREVTEVAFLQTGVKLRKAEVDAVYRLTVAGRTEFLVAVEAKGSRDRLVLQQVLRATQALKETDAGKRVDGRVIPFALKVVGKSLVHVVEFAEVRGDELPPIAAQSLFELVPAVPGVE